ncbi:MAG: serine/threonine-protein kinase [Myxococcota bacterium]
MAQRPVSPGDRLGDYVVEHGLGAGAMARVVRARRRGCGTVVALKLVERDCAERRRRLWLEGALQARVAHRHVVAVVERFRDAGRPILALEHVDGPDLADRLGEGPPELRAVDRLVEGLGAGLAAVHAAGLVHGDVKPANVLLAPGGVCKLADFGLARPAGRDTGGPGGTPRYMAPEQWAGGAVDARADVFALGCLLYEALTDRHAFPGEPAAARARIRAGAFVPIRQLRRDLSPARIAAVERCLAPDPGDRPADAAALVAAWRVASAAARCDDPASLAPRRGAEETLACAAS